MTYNKSKRTSRFSFDISQNSTAKRAGSNTLTISTNPESGRYSYGGTSLTMTVREAKSLMGFLNETFNSDYQDSDSTTSI